MVQTSSDGSGHGHTLSADRGHPRHRRTVHCGDGNSRLAGLRWSQWDDKAAVARGTSLVNDCKPYCAAGRFHSYPVEVRLEKPAPWKKNPQVKQYTQITLHFTDGRPSGYGKQVTYPLWG
jgi:hypothetical protein